MLVKIIFVLALCAVTFVLAISTLALALYLLNLLPSQAPQSEPVDLRAARLRGIA